MRRLEGRVAVVSGAGRGLGREVALALAAEGVSLLVLSRTAAQLRALAEEVGGSVPVLPAAVDVRDAAAVERVVAHAEQRLGPVDLLVNAAAVVEPVARPFWEADAAEVWDVVETNLRGPLLLTRALLPQMVARGHGHVVNVASRALAAQRSGAYTGYAVSKRALSLLTEALAASLAGTGVVVVDVLPGLVRTALTTSMSVWADVPDDGWDPAAATARTVVDVALGRHDDAAGTVLDAPALWRTAP